METIARILEIFSSNDFPKLKENIRNVFGLLKIPVLLILFYYSLLSFEWLFEWDLKLIDMLRDTENKYIAFLQTQTYYLVMLMSL